MRGGLGLWRAWQRVHAAAASAAAPARAETGPVYSAAFVVVHGYRGRGGGGGTVEAVGDPRGGSILALDASKPPWTAAELAARDGPWVLAAPSSGADRRYRGGTGARRPLPNGVWRMSYHPGPGSSGDETIRPLPTAESEPGERGSPSRPPAPSHEQGPPPGRATKQDPGNHRGYRPRIGPYPPDPRRWGVGEMGALRCC